LQAVKAVRQNYHPTVVARKSKLTEKEALEIGKAIKQSLSERYSRAQGRND